MMALCNLGIYDLHIGVNKNDSGKSNQSKLGAGPDFSWSELSRTNLAQVQCKPCSSQSEVTSMLVEGGKKKSLKAFQQA